MRKRFIFLFFAVSLLFSSANAGTHEEKVEKTFSMRKGGELILDNENGRVTIESWGREEIKVEAIKIVKTGSRRRAQEIMREIQIDFVYDADDAYLGVKTRIPRKHNGFWDDIFGDGASVSVTYHLMVPDQLDMVIESVNGKIEVSDVAGDIQVETTNGSIKIRGAGGRVDAKTTNGSIEAELQKFTANEDMLFKTTNGGITAYFPGDFHAEIDARTTNGSVRTDFPIRVQGEISKRRLRGTINEGGGRIKLHTTNGSIRILEF